MVASKKRRTPPVPRAGPKVLVKVDISALKIGINDLLENGKRSVGDYIVDIYDDILELKKRNFTNQQIEAKLVESGLAIKNKQLAVYMSRIAAKKARDSGLTVEKQIKEPSAKTLEKRQQRAKAELIEGNRLAAIAAKNKIEADKSALPKTGFHKVVEALEVKMSGSDPRRS